MKTDYSVMAILAASVIIGMVTIGSQQIYAPRTCAGCADFKKLTTQFEKDVIAASDDPNTIKELVDEFSGKVLELFRTPSTSP